VSHPVFNEANLLEQMNVNLRGASTTTLFVTNIDYNAKGQRTLIEYGNGAQTAYGYDPENFRLTELKTTRASDKAILQDLSYSYDPVGNITSIGDAAQQTVYFSNQVVAANNDYTYDAVYRLVSATGRELIGLLAQPQPTWDDLPRINQPLPTDGQAMRNYVETYSYDAAGNILQVAHQAVMGNWTRTYAYDETNPSPSNNRLTSTTVGALKEPYSYDLHGNMTSMPHLPQMAWDFKDQLASTQRQVVNDAPGEITYYVYDSSGQRVRKVTQSGSGAKTKERIYLGGYEVYREYSGSSASLERQTLHVMDDKRRLAFVETNTTAGAAPVLRYQFDNHLGSASLELDIAAAIISYEEYYPYGSTSFQSVSSTVQVSLKRYRYTGKERDEETGLSYHSARYYAPWLARWASCDPSGLADGYNLYSYTRDNPIRLTDPGGRQSQGELHQTGRSQPTPEQQAAADMASKNAYGGPWRSSPPETFPSPQYSRTPEQAAADKAYGDWLESHDAYGNPRRLTLAPMAPPKVEPPPPPPPPPWPSPPPQPAAEGRDAVTVGVDTQAGASAVGLSKSSKPSADALQVTLLPRNLEVIPLYYKPDGLDIALLKEPGAQVQVQQQPQDKGKGWETHTTVSGTVDAFNLSVDPFEVALTGTGGLRFHRA
jgi:RHS repeat-associated protein